MTTKIIYVGDLRTESIHIQSKSSIETDAPIDNMGKGERFSPTDLVVTALGACILTTMAIKANTMNIELKGSKIEGFKFMELNPRRISKIIINVKMLKSLNLDNKQKTILENTAKTCPVERSLHADIQIDINFEW